MRILQRLCWKEYRESGPFVLIGVLLPLLCLAFHKFRGDIVELPYLIILIMIAAWAAARAQEKRGVGLPISTPMHLAARYLLNMVGLLAIGASIGCLIAYRQDYTDNLNFIYVHTDKILPIMGSCIFVYMFCTVISAIFTPIPALFAGVYLAFICCEFGFTHSEINRAFVRMLSILLITVVFWEGYRGKRRVLIARIAFPLLITLAICWETVDMHDLGDLLPASTHRGNNAPYNISGDNSHYFAQGIVVNSNLFSADSNRALTIDYQPYLTHLISLNDLRIPRRYFIAPEHIAPRSDHLRALNCLDRHLVIFAAQAPGSSVVRVMAWDATSGQVCERFRFTGWRDLLATCHYSIYSADDRYISLYVQSKIARGDDIWQLDLQKNRAKLQLGEGQ